MVGSDGGGVCVCWLVKSRKTKKHSGVPAFTRNRENYQTQALLFSYFVRGNGEEKLSFYHTIIEYRSTWH